MQLPKPKNQWALAVYLLAENKNTGLTNADATKTDTFYKFQTRVGEVLKGRENDLKIRKLRVKFVNRFTHNGSHTNYKSLANIKYLCNLINKLNREGAKALNA